LPVVAAPSCVARVVAVADAVSRLPELESASHPRLVLSARSFSKSAFHHAFQADVQVRDVTLGERDDVHAGEGKAFEESGGVFLVPAESIECFGEDNVECWFNASRISAWNPERKNVAREIA
jgi:hypothetical protein